MSPDRADLSAIPPQTQDWPGTTAALDRRPTTASTWTGRERLIGRRALITGATPASAGRSP
ncbi:hypothetical protein [Janibacter melonis]|uniref:hypothetical protein n=1 Tax=Janibacter melonis TaxID=262209 RepID=UPI002095E159|nr:hypothetical protein [Janibacter melonis]